LGMLHKETGDFEQARSCFETFLSKALPTEYRGSIQNVQKELAEVLKLQRRSSNQSPSAR